MSRKRVIAALAAVSALAVFLLLPAGTALSQQIQSVFVTNFPDLQKIEGKVAIEGPVRHALLVALKDITVSPVSPKDTQRLIQGGTLVTDGFSEVVFSLTGQIRGEVFKPAAVGAILLPDEEPIQKIFEEKGEMQFPMEVTAASVSGASPYFSSSQPRFLIGFPRYRVLFYNTSAKTVSVNLYAYLTN